MGIFDRIRDKFAGSKASDRAQPAAAEPQPQGEAIANTYGARSGSKEAPLSADRAANVNAPTPLDVRDAEGISARDRINDALKSVDAYKQARGLGEVPPSTMSPEFGHRAGEDVSAAWDDPAAAKAMRAAGASRIGMMDDVGRAKLEGVRQVLATASGKVTPETTQAATPLTTPDERGITGRDWMDRAKLAVSTYQEFSNPSNWMPSNRTLDSFRRDAEYAIAGAWQHPEAAKAMRVAGATERGMQDDLSAGKTAKVIEGLSAPDPAMVKQKQATSEAAKPQDATQAPSASAAKPAREGVPDPRAYARDHWQKLAAAGAEAAKAAQSARQSETQGKRVAPRM